VKSLVGVRWSWLLVLGGLCALVGAGAGAEATAADTSRKAVVAQAEDLSDHLVVLMFDDGWHCVFTDAYPLLKEHGMTAVLPLISDYVGKSATPHRTGTPYGYMNRAEVQEMIDSLGIEIASHSKSHPFLTRLSDEAVDSELRQSRRALEAMFGREVTSFVYPYGDYDSRVRRLVAEAGYSVARSISPGTVNFNERQYDLPSSEVRRTTSLSTVQGWITRKPVLILFFHRIVVSPGNYTDWSRDRFADLLDWLEERNVQVVTLQDLYRNRKLPGAAILATRRSWKNRIEWDLLEEIDVDITGPAKRR
jgi:peptidoglycan/xylan/chitin deacetylase (PgdA/CDA1 family)